MKRFLRLLALLLVIALALLALIVALYTVVPPPLTPLMALRWFHRNQSQSRKTRAESQGQSRICARTAKR